MRKCPKYLTSVHIDHHIKNCLKSLEEIRKYVSKLILKKKYTRVIKLCWNFSKLNKDDPDNFTTVIAFLPTGSADHVTLLSFFSGARCLVFEP